MRRPFYSTNARRAAARLLHCITSILFEQNQLRLVTGTDPSPTHCAVRNDESDFLLHNTGHAMHFHDSSAAAAPRRSRTASCE